MKPRTKVQKEIVELYAQLPPLTGEQKEWARKNATAHIGFCNKGYMWCSECGCITPCPEDVGKTHVCPCCGEKLNISISRKKKNESREYVTFITTIGGYQVLRHYVHSQCSFMGSRPDCNLVEAVQEWIDEDGGIHYIARRRNAFNYYVDNWIFSQDLELREADGYSIYAYQVHANFIYPKMRILPILKRNGLRTSFHGVTPSKLMLALLGKYPHAEWLLKSKQYGILEYYLSYGGLPYVQSIKICLRNHYKIKDFALWRDYLDNLVYFGKDIHNAHYVCPKNIKEAHDRWAKKKAEAEKKRIEAEKCKNIAEWEGRYAKEKGKFLGISFSCPGINVTVLPSVNAFVEEAKHMHHCVYDNGYYKKKESLILSAKDDRGKRLETIEVNLKTFEIVQCYGACNKFTPQHEQIKELVNKNMNLIRKAV